MNKYLPVLFITLSAITHATHSEQYASKELPNQEVAIREVRIHAYLDWYIAPWLHGFKEIDAIFESLKSTFPGIKFVKAVADPMMYGSWDSWVDYSFSIPTNYSLQEIQNFLNNQLKEQELRYITMTVKAL